MLVAQWLWLLPSSKKVVGFSQCHWILYCTDTSLLISMIRICDDLAKCLESYLTLFLKHAGISLSTPSGCVRCKYVLSFAWWWCARWSAWMFLDSSRGFLLAKENSVDYHSWWSWRILLSRVSDNFNQIFNLNLFRSAVVSEIALDRVISCRDMLCSMLQLSLN